MSDSAFRGGLCRRPLMAAAGLGFGLAALAQASDRLSLATLEWPPYTGARLPAQGASSQVLREALRARGWALELAFMPWARALVEGSSGERLLGFFPAYRSEARDSQLLRSARIGSSRIGFAYRGSEPPRWKTLDDLGSQAIGVVRGFVNPDELDRRLRDGRLRSEAAVSDEENLRKLAFGRVQLAVVDEAVFHALTGPQGPLAAEAPRLRFLAERLLEEKSLHVYLQRRPAGERALAQLDRGLAALDVDAVFSRSL